MQVNKIIRNVLLFLASAILYGIIEGMVFSHGFSIGPPDLWVFKSWYHLPMAGLVAILAYTLDSFSEIPLWMLLEDIVYWIVTGDPLMPGSWVSFNLGGFHIAGQYLPWTYFLLLGAWGVIVAIKLVEREYKREAL